MSDKNKHLLKETAKNRLYKYGDYLSWADEERYELIDGQVCIMSPALSRQHQKTLVELIRQFSTYLLNKDCEVYAAPFDVRLSEGGEKEEEILTVVQPDISVVCDDNKLDKLGCIGAPDLVIEIISPFSGGRDRKVKRDLYEKHGVKEYWLVDYDKKTVEVYLLNEDNQYGKPAVYLEDEKVPVNIFSDLEIVLSYVFR